MSKVLIAQRFIKQYRLPFFDALHETLKNDGIELQVVFGQPMTAELRKGDTPLFEREWGVAVKNRWLLDGRFLYQPLWRQASRADLVIVEQANLHLMNIPLLGGRRLGGYKVAFWGHGRNLQARKAGPSERLKRLTLGWPDWWFAYTKGVGDYLVGQGVSPEIVTSVQNSIDTVAFRADLDAVSDRQLELLRQRLGIGEGDPVGLFCGSLYADKRIDFLLEAGRRVHQRLPGFRLVVLGGGPDSPLVEQAAARENWIHFPGPVFGIEKASWFRMANVFLNPGLVGLAILDALCAGLPLMTTAIPWHSPEIDYLEDGCNGLMTPNSLDAFSAAVVALIDDPNRRERLRQGALHSAEIYSLERMVTNFRNGIIGCLGRE